MPGIVRVPLAPTGRVSPLERLPGNPNAPVQARLLVASVLRGVAAEAGQLFDRQVSKIEAEAKARDEDVEKAQLSLVESRINGFADKAMKGVNETPREVLLSERDAVSHVDDAVEAFQSQLIDEQAQDVSPAVRRQLELATPPLVQNFRNSYQQQFDSRAKDAARAQLFEDNDNAANRVTSITDVEGVTDQINSATFASAQLTEEQKTEEVQKQQFNIFRRLLTSGQEVEDLARDIDDEPEALANRMNSEQHAQIVTLARNIASREVDQAVKNLAVNALMTREEIVREGLESATRKMKQADAMLIFLDTGTAKRQFSKAQLEPMRQSVQTSRDRADFYRSAFIHGENVLGRTIPSGGPADPLTAIGVSLFQEKSETYADLLLNGTPFDIASKFNEDVLSSGFVSNFWQREMQGRLQNPMVGNGRNLEIVVQSMGRAVEDNEMLVVTPEIKGLLVKEIEATLSPSQLSIVLEVRRRTAGGEVDIAAAYKSVLERRSKLDRSGILEEYDIQGIRKKNREALPDLINDWGYTPNPNLQMYIDFEGFVQTNMIQRMEINEARQVARLQLLSKWTQPTGGLFGGEWVAYAMETRYGTYSTDQLREEVVENVIGGDKVDLDSLKSVALPGRDGTMSEPRYAIFSIGPGGAPQHLRRKDGKEFFFVPEYQTSPENVAKIKRSTNDERLHLLVDNWDAAREERGMFTKPVRGMAPTFAAGWSKLYSDLQFSKGPDGKFKQSEVNHFWRRFEILRDKEVATYSKLTSKLRREGSLEPGDARLRLRKLEWLQRVGVKIPMVSGPPVVRPRTSASPLFPSVPPGSQ
jgi:hypothetical protein